jgi:ubiquinone biosynthesis protein
MRLVGLVGYAFYYRLPSAIFAYVNNRRNKTDDKEGATYLGKRMIKFLHRAGPSFIKLGQVLSTRPDILGDELAEALAELQDKVPPFSYTAVKRTVEGQLKCKISEAFSEFAPTPVAAASIAQVHRARTLAGELVAVKVLRPGIERSFRNDLKLMSFIARFIEFWSKEARRLRFRDIVETMEKIVTAEMDLRMEAAASDQLRENCKNDAGLYIPKITWQLTAQRVMTMEWIEGIPLHDVERLRHENYSINDITQKLAVIFFNQAFRDGFFHADMHPGNLFVLPNGDIALIDFGIMGHMEKKDRVFMVKTLHHFLQRDYQKVADLHFEIGYVPPDQDRHMFALACRSLGEPIVGLPVNQISMGKLLKQLLEVSRRFKMPVQIQLIMLQKTMVTIEGIGYMLNPEVNMWKLAEPWIKAWAAKNFSATQRAKELFKEAAAVVDHLPAILSKVRQALD